MSNDCGIIASYMVISWRFLSNNQLTDLLSFTFICFSCEVYLDKDYSAKVLPYTVAFLLCNNSIFHFHFVTEVMRPGNIFGSISNKIFVPRNLVLREKCPNTELFLVRIFRYSDWIRRFTKSLYSIRIQENTTRNNSVFGHFSRSVVF